MGCGEKNGPPARDGYPPWAESKVGEVAGLVPAWAPGGPSTSKFRALVEHGLSAPGLPSKRKTRFLFYVCRQAGARGAVSAGFSPRQSLPWGRAPTPALRRVAESKTHGLDCPTSGIGTDFCDWPRLFPHAYFKGDGAVGPTMSFKKLRRGKRSDAGRCSAISRMVPLACKTPAQKNNHDGDHQFCPTTGRLCSSAVRAACRATKRRLQQQHRSPSEHSRQTAASQITGKSRQIGFPARLQYPSSTSPKHQRNRWGFFVKSRNSAD